MNFKKIMNMQKKLDAAYKIEGATNVTNLETKRIIAILVELGEFANEYSTFKYWKKNIKIDRDKLIEEFVDGVHFFCTFMNKYRVNYNVEPIINSDDMSVQLIDTFKAIINMSGNINQKTIKTSFATYLGNAKLLKISDDEIEDYYIRKNKINYDRIKNGY